MILLILYAVAIGFAISIAMLHRTRKDVQILLLNASIAKDLERRIESLIEAVTLLKEAVEKMSEKPKMVSRSPFLGTRTPEQRAKMRAAALKQWEKRKQEKMNQQEPKQSYGP